MGHYDDIIRNHKVNRAIASVERSLQLIQREKLDQDQVQIMDRIAIVIQMVKHAVASINPTLATSTSLEQLRASLNELRQAIDAGANSGLTHSIDLVVDGVIDKLSNVPTAGALLAAEGSSKLIQDFKSSAELHLEQLTTLIEKAKTATHESVIAIKNNEARISELQEILSREKARFDKLINDQQSTFGSSENSRNRQFQESNDKNRAEFEAVVRQSQDNHQKVIQESAEIAKDFSSKLQKDLEESQRIVGLVANVGMAGGYQKVANEERKQANFWRWCAVASLVSAAAFLGFVVLYNTLDHVDWKVILFRISFVTIFLIPAWYCGKESSHHRHQEARNRRIELELASLRPFISSLDQNKAGEIIEKKADAFFLGASEIKTDSGDDVNMKNMLVRGDNLMKTVQKVAEAVKSKR